MVKECNKTAGPLCYLTVSNMTAISSHAKAPPEVLEKELSIMRQEQLQALLIE